MISNASGFSDKYLPDYEYILTHHPEWIIRNRDGSKAQWYHDKQFLHLDLGNPHYVDWVITWLKSQTFGGGPFRGHLGLDYGIFKPDRRWAKYDREAAYQDAWEYFLRRISQAFRPDYKVVLNVGGCDLPTFARLIRWVDGVLFEDFYPPVPATETNLRQMRRSIRDRWEKGQWCQENGKIWAVRHRASVAAIKLAPKRGAHPVFISLGDSQASISLDNNQTLGKISFGREETDTLGKVAMALEKYNLTATLMTAYPESASPGGFNPLNHKEIKEDLVLKLKQAPREAFLFGYAAFLMAAGPNAYFILGDERHEEYWYPEMDLPLGLPKGPRREVAPGVFCRDFQKCAVFLNLSATSYALPNLAELPPWRGAIIFAQGGSSLSGSQTR
jgi:hypothetical protein